MIEIRQKRSRSPRLVLALHEVGVRGESDFLKAPIVPKTRLPRGAHWVRICYSGFSHVDPVIAQLAGGARPDMFD